MPLTAISIGASTVAFLIYLYVSNTTFVEKRFAKNHITSAQTRQILFNRFLGFFLFGIIPFLIISNISKLSAAKLGLGFGFSLNTALIVIAIAIVPVIVNFFVARTPDNLAMYPQIRARNWDKSLLFISALSWIMYLLGYETMLRGVLFYSCLSEMSLWPAIMINTSIYALIHIPKGMKETLGSIPMGIILCLLTFYTGSIWAAFVVHCSLALTNEWFSIKYSSELCVE